MKYSVLGFNQEVVLSYKREVKDGDKSVVVKLDLDDLLILKEISDLANRPSIEKKILDGAMYCWIQYKLILEDLPILDISKKRLQQRLDKLCMFDLIERRVEKVQGVGTFHYVRVSNEYENLLYDRDRNNFNTDGNKFLPDGNIFPPKDNTTIQYKNTQEDKEKEIDKSISTKKATSIPTEDEHRMFEDFRLAYKGRKRGHDTEFDFFISQNKDWREVLPLLVGAITKENELREEARAMRKFFPEQKNMQTYLNGKNRAWEVYVEDTNATVSTPKESKDAICINGQIYR